MRAIVSGEHEPTGALVGALMERDVQAELVAIHHHPGERAVSALAEALVELEGRLTADRPDVAIAVALGDVPIALALVATKLGVPLLTCQREHEQADDPSAGPDRRLEAAEWRILDQLSEQRFDLPGERVGADVVAERITDWARDAGLAGE